MKVVGIDLSLTGTGLAVVADGSLNASTVKVPPTLRGVDRLEHIVTAVRLWADYATLAVLEGPSYGSGTRGRQNGHHERAGLWWLVRVALDRASIPLAVVEPARLKRYATGKGIADKSAMALAMGHRLPDVELDTDDEIDAAWLALMGADHLGHPLVHLPKTHRIALDNIGWPERETST